MSCKHMNQLQIELICNETNDTNDSQIELFRTETNNSIYELFRNDYKLGARLELFSNNRVTESRVELFDHAKHYKFFFKKLNLTMIKPKIETLTFGSNYDVSAVNIYDVQYNFPESFISRFMCDFLECEDKDRKIIARNTNKLFCNQKVDAKSALTVFHQLLYLKDTFEYNLKKKMLSGTVFDVNEMFLIERMTDVTSDAIYINQAFEIALNIYPDTFISNFVSYLRNNYNLGKNKQLKLIIGEIAKSSDLISETINELLTMEHTTDEIILTYLYRLNNGFKTELNKRLIIHYELIIAFKYNFESIIDMVNHQKSNISLEDETKIINILNKDEICESNIQNILNEKICKMLSNTNISVVLTKAIWEKIYFRINIEKKFDILSLIDTLPDNIITISYLEFDIMVERYLLLSPSTLKPMLICADNVSFDTFKFMYEQHKNCEIPSKSQLFETITKISKNVLKHDVLKLSNRKQLNMNYFVELLQKNNDIDILNKIIAKISDIVPTSYYVIKQQYMINFNKNFEVFINWLTKLSGITIRIINDVFTLLCNNAVSESHMTQYIRAMSRELNQTSSYLFCQLVIDLDIKVNKRTNNMNYLEFIYKNMLLSKIIMPELNPIRAYNYEAPNSIYIVFFSLQIMKLAIVDTLNLREKTTFHLIYETHCKLIIEYNFGCLLKTHTEYKYDDITPITFIMKFMFDNITCETPILNTYISEITGLCSRFVTQLKTCPRLADSFGLLMANENKIHNDIKSSVKKTIISYYKNSIPTKQYQAQYFGVVKYIHPDSSVLTDYDNLLEKNVIPSDALYYKWAIQYKTTASSYDISGGPGVTRDFIDFVTHGLKKYFSMKDNFLYINPTYENKNIYNQIGILIMKSFMSDETNIKLDLHPYILYKITNDIDQLKDVEMVQNILRVKESTDEDFSKMLKMEFEPEELKDNMTRDEYCVLRIKEIYESEFETGLNELISGFQLVVDINKMKKFNISYFTDCIYPLDKSKYIDILNTRMKVKDNSGTGLVVARLNFLHKIILKIANNMDLINLIKLVRFWCGTSNIQKETLDRDLILSPFFVDNRNKSQSHKFICRSTTCHYTMYIPIDQTVDIVDTNEEQIQTNMMLGIECSMKNQELVDEVGLRMQKT